MKAEIASLARKTAKVAGVRHAPRSWRAAAVLGILLAGTLQAQQPGTNNVSSLYDIALKQIDGTATNLAHLRGRVLLIVNVASKCGFTGQYAGLQKLYETHKDRGLVVLGFPANDFMGQEPGTNEEIAKFCSVQYHVTFPMFEKITVKGKDMHALYRYLTDKATNPQFAGPITWNFNKFLVGRDGRIVARFDSRTKPDDQDLIKAVEQALQH